ncbi:histone H1.8-like [Salvelinus alpinus]
MSGKAKPESSNAPAVARRTPLHPPTMVMVNEALKELDSRKGVSSQAIRGFITEKYPSVDLVRLKYMIRKTLKKGFEGGVLVRTSTRKQTEHRGGFGLQSGVGSRSPSQRPLRTLIPMWRRVQRLPRLEPRRLRTRKPKLRRKRLQPKSRRRNLQRMRNSGSPQKHLLPRWPLLRSPSRRRQWGRGDS